MSSLHCVYNFRDACETALKEKHERDLSQMEGFVDDSNSAYSKQLEALGQVFRKASEEDTPTDVRRHFFIFIFSFFHLNFVCKKLINL